MRGGKLRPAGAACVRCAIPAFAGKRQPCCTRGVVIVWRRQTRVLVNGAFRLKERKQKAVRCYRGCKLFAAI